MATRRSFNCDEDKESRTARCTKCDIWKPFSEFYIIRHEPNRRNTQSSCKACQCAYHRERLAKKREERRKEEEGLPTKVCKHCGEEKPKHRFRKYRGEHYVDRYMNQCLDCLNDKQNENRRKRLARGRESWEKAYYRTVKGRARYLLGGAKARAKKLQIDFDLDLDWLVEKINGVCERTGMAFELTNTGIGKRSLTGPSIDRIDAQGPYTKENCQVVILGYNLAKSDGTDEFVLRMAKALVAKSEEDNNKDAHLWYHLAACSG